VRLAAIKAAGLPHHLQALPVLQKLLQESAAPEGARPYTGSMTSMAAAIRQASGPRGLVVDSRLAFEAAEDTAEDTPEAPAESDLYLPDQCIAYIALDGLEETTRLLQSAPLIQEVQRLKFWEDLQTSEVLGYPRLAHFQLHRAFQFFQKEVFLMGLIGRTLRVVFCPSAGLQPDILLAGTIDFKVKAAEKLLTLVQGLGLTITPMQHEEYEGVRITSLALPGRQRPLHYLYFDDRLFLSSNRQLLKHVVDLKQRRLGSAIAFDPDYRQARHALGTGAPVFLYLRRDFSLAGMQAQTQGRMRQAILRSIAAITATAPEPLMAASALQPEPPKRPASTAAYPESVQDILGFVPKDAAALWIINRYDGYLHYMAALGEAGARLVAMVAQDLGRQADDAEALDLERDFFSLYDKNRLFVVYKGVHTTQDEPFPSLLLGLKLREPGQSAGQEFLRTVLRDKYNVTQEDYHTVPMTTFHTEHSFAPVYATVGGYLLLATEAGILKDVIDTHAGLNPSLADYGRYTKLQAAIKEAVGDVTLYLNPARTMASLEEQLKILAGDGRALRFNRVDLQEKITPLFTALGSVEVVGGRMQQQGDTFMGHWLVLLRE
jgi:Protein of unknown function (DUF3352)